MFTQHPAVRAWSLVNRGDDNNPETFHYRKRRCSHTSQNKYERGVDLSPTQCVVQACVIMGVPRQSAEGAFVAGNPGAEVLLYAC